MRLSMTFTMQAVLVSKLLDMRRTKPAETMYGCVCVFISYFALVTHHVSVRLVNSSICDLPVLFSLLA